MNHKLIGSFANVFSFPIILAQAFFGTVLYCQLLAETLAGTKPQLLLLALVFWPTNLDEYLLISVFLATIPRMLGYGFTPLWITLLVTTAINLFLIADQVYYDLFAQHISLAASDGEVPNLRNLISSFLAQVTWLTWFNFALALLAAIYIFKSLQQAKVATEYSHKQGFICAIILVWLCISAFYSPPNSLPKLDIVSSFFSGYGSDFEKSSAPDTNLTPELFETIKSNYKDSEAELFTLAKNRAILRQLATEKPNIIFIVLESVGSLQIMPKEGFQSNITPFLHKISRQSVIFDNLYTIFPSTARSHIPMLTGGNIITWGSVFDEFNYPYTEKNLISDLKQQGYTTGFFSSGDLSYENRYAFYKNLPFDYLAGYNTFDDKSKRQHRLNSWGVEEDFAWSQAKDWLLGKKSQGKPFFLHYMTVATHHPYDIPESLAAPFPKSTPQKKYHNALFYTDTLIERIFSDLKANNLDGNTLVIISGDHGEAFGDRHPGNFTHKNYLFEENIRTFLLINAPGNTALTGQTIERPGAIGDIAPTVLALANIHSAYNNATNLLASDYKPRLNFFHKGTTPHQWGLRDGRWKFIENIRDGKPQLYDLADDPLEMRNLAADHPGLVSDYHERVESWFFAQNKQFRAALENYPNFEGYELLAEDLKAPGPKNLKIGVMADALFIPKETFNASEAITSWIRLVPYEKNTQLYYWWVAPSGREIHISPFVIQKGWTTARLAMPKQEFSKLPSGEWTLLIKDKQQILFEQKFTLQ